MARHKVEIVNVNTANIKVLTKDEMDELFKKLKDGDPFAREDLINGNLKLVLSILKKFNGRCDNMDDLFQVGCIGLVKAIDNFDTNVGVLFSTYAVPMISGEVKRYLRDNSSIRISRSIKDLAYRSLKAKEELTDKLNREPTIEEISKEINEPEVDIINAMDAMRTPVSIFEPIYNDGGDTIYLYDKIKDESKEKNDVNTSISLKDAINKLSKREKQIINERFIIGKTQTEIANELGISQAQISRLEKNAISYLKDILT